MSPDTEKQSHGRIVRSATAMSLMTMLSRIFGLIRDILLAGMLGTGMHMEAFRVGSIIANTLRRLLGEGAMTAAFVPTFAEVEEKRSREELWRFAGTFFCTFTLILLIVAALGVIFSPQIVDLFTSRGSFDNPAKYELTVNLNRIIFPYIAMVSIAAVIMAILNSLGKFAPSAFTPVLLNIAMILCGWAFANAFVSPAYGFAIGFLIGGLAQVLFQVPFLRKYGGPFVLRISFVDPYVRQVFRLMMPGLFAVGITQINLLITTRILSGLDEGQLGGIYYANRLNELTLGVFAVSIATVILPSMSRRAARGDIDALKRTLSFAIRLISFVSIPAATGLIILREPIVSVLFQRGEFNEASVQFTALPLIYFSAGLLVFALIKVLAPAFYAVKKIHIPVAVSSVDMVLNVMLAYFLSRFMGNSGVALALTIGATANVTILLIIFMRMYGAFDFRKIFVTIGKVIVASAFMGLFAYFANYLLDYNGLTSLWSRAAWLLSVITISVAIFMVSCKLLKIKEMADVSRMLLKRELPTENGK